jgi:16S rRNA (uracil1498-N3)-methyltransferase
MSRYDFSAQRLFVRSRLAAGMLVELDRGQANYLTNVLRMRPGDPILLFNGRDGEWKARLTEGRRPVLAVESETRAQTPPSNLHYLFAPLKQARLDYMVQKAVEMGVGRLRPAVTRHTQVGRVNIERLSANAVEAAEQCGILTIPDVDEPAPLAELILSWADAENGRRIVFCDEDEAGADPLATLAGLPAGPLAVLVGPEGGFSADERELLRRQDFVTPLALGPRILRADTAAVAALALVQATRGDWRG